MDYLHMKARAEKLKSEVENLESEMKLFERKRVTVSDLVEVGNGHFHGIELSPEQGELISSDLRRVLSEPKFKTSMKTKERIDLEFDAKILAAELVQRYFNYGIRVLHNKPVVNSKQLELAV